MYFIFTIVFAVVMFGYLMLYIVYIYCVRAIVQAMTVCAVGLGTNDTLDEETVSYYRTFLPFDGHISCASFIITKSICASSYRNVLSYFSCFIHSTSNTKTMLL